MYHWFGMPLAAMNKATPSRLSDSIGGVLLFFEACFLRKIAHDQTFGNFQMPVPENRAYASNHLISHSKWKMVSTFSASKIKVLTVAIYRYFLSDVFTFRTKLTFEHWWRILQSSCCFLLFLSFIRHALRVISMLALTALFILNKILYSLLNREKLQSDEEKKDNDIIISN